VSAAIIERLRETLDGLLPEAQAASILFAALARWGPRIPTDEIELAQFVRGALRDELSDRLEQKPLAPVLAELEAVLATAGAPTADHEIPIDVEIEPRWRDEISTKAMRSIEGPVPVLVIAASTAFALRLRLALGEAMIDVEARADLAGVERALRSSPALTVIDARDPSGIPIDRLADVLAHATGTTTIVWGSDTPYGKRIVDASEGRGAAFAGLASTEGIGPIFDLVTSRRS